MNDFFKIQNDNPEFPDRQLKRKFEKHDISDLWKGGHTSLVRESGAHGVKMRGLAVALLFFAALLIGRLLQLQIVEGASLRARAEGNRIRILTVLAPRGLFFDRNGTPLVENKPAFFLSFAAADLPPSEEELSSQLAVISRVTAKDEEELFSIVKSEPRVSFRAVPLVDALSYDQMIELKSSLSNWSGIFLGIRGTRQYLFKDAVSHILGYMGKISEEEYKDSAFEGYTLTDYVGRAGLEQYYEQYLRGRPGKKEVEINVRGKEQKVINDVKPEAGADVMLSLDIKIQKKLYDLLTERLKDIGGQKATAVALDPRNGDVLAMVSIPSFDNNMFSATLDPSSYNRLVNDERKPLFFRALQGVYPTGSTFKPLVALAALHYGIITPQTSFLSTGGIRVNQWFFPDWKSGGHGVTNVIKALAESVNTFFYIIGGGYQSFEGLGIERITSFATKLYFTRALGIDFPGEAKGFLPSQEWKAKTKGERWFIGDTYNASIGQGDILSTPLQLTSFVAYLANGGTLYRPHFLKSVRFHNNTSTESEPRVLLSGATDASYISVVRAGMRAAVEQGSARRLNALFPFTVAGKTGTAQVGGGKKPHAWFVSFAPYDQPTIALTILIENGGEGSEAAVPVAYDFYQWYKDYYSADQ